MSISKAVPSHRAGFDQTIYYVAFVCANLQNHRGQSAQNGQGAGNEMVVKIRLLPVPEVSNPPSVPEDSASLPAASGYELVRAFALPG